MADEPMMLRVTAEELVICAVVGPCCANAAPPYNAAATAAAIVTLRFIVIKLLGKFAKL
jgi:hypothetical protein